MGFFSKTNHRPHRKGDYIPIVHKTCIFNIIINRVFEIFKIDQIMYETQLGIDWKPPRKLKYLDVSNLPSYKKKLKTPSTESMFTGIVSAQHAYLINAYNTVCIKDLITFYSKSTFK